jgi:hypothetical protein
VVLAAAEPIYMLEPKELLDKEMLGVKVLVTERAVVAGLVQLGWMLLPQPVEVMVVLELHRLFLEL